MIQLVRLRPHVRAGYNSLICRLWRKRPRNNVFAYKAKHTAQHKVRVAACQNTPSVRVALCVNVAVNVALAQQRNTYRNPCLVPTNDEINNDPRIRYSSSLHTEPVVRYSGAAFNPSQQHVFSTPSSDKNSPPPSQSMGASLYVLAQIYTRLRFGGTLNKALSHISIYIYRYYVPFPPAAPALVLVAHGTL